MNVLHRVSLFPSHHPFSFPLNPASTSHSLKAVWPSAAPSRSCGLESARGVCALQGSMERCRPANCEWPQQCCDNSVALIECRCLSLVRSCHPSFDRLLSFCSVTEIPHLRIHSVYYHFFSHQYIFSAVSLASHRRRRGDGASSWRGTHC